MNSNDVLNNIRDEMEDYIQSSRSPYTSDISEVARGAHGVKQAINKPYVGIYMLEDEPLERLIGCNDIWIVTAELYCYMMPEIDGVYDELHKLKDNIVYFLTNDCAHRKNIDVSKFRPIEGGIITTVNYYTLIFTVKYEYELEL